MQKITQTAYDRYLNLLGISQYSLRKGAILQGEVSLHILQSTKLLMIADDSMTADDPLLLAILRAMHLQPEQIQIITTERVSLLPKSLHCAIWALGCSLPDTVKSAAPQLTSPSLDILRHSAQDKRQFWQLICNYEDYFFTRAE